MPQLPRSLLLAACLTLPLGGQAAITFLFSYQDQIDATGFGFDDPTLGLTRRATVASVGDYLNTVLTGSGTVEIHWQTSMNNSGNGFLGQISPYFPDASAPAGFYPSSMFTHAFDALDTTGPEDPDGLAVINFGYNWNSDLGSPAGNEYDLFSVALHETVHGLGFMTLISSSGGYFTGFEGIRSTFDKYLQGPGGSLLDASGAFVGSVSDLTSGAVTFGGPAATAANGGQPVPIYSPVSFASGSSLSHIAPSLPALMNPTLGTGIERRSLGGVELAMLQDMTAAATVPEPRDAALAAAVGLLTLAALRRRIASSPPCPPSDT